jgi:hypothetical protein
MAKRYGHIGQKVLKQRIAQDVRIRRRQSKRGGENASLVPATWMRGIEAVVAKFDDVALAAGQLHLEREYQIIGS